MPTALLRRVALALLAALFCLQPLLALAQSELLDEDVTHYAVASVALKVRRQPTRDSGSTDSIPKGSYVYILEYGDEFCKVRTSVTEGYVLTEYLEDVREYQPMAVAESAEDVDPEAVDYTFVSTPETFVENYISHAVKNAGIYEQPNAMSRRIETVPIYDEVTVSEIHGEWCYLRYKTNVYGYAQVSSLFKWDRIDPYAGDIPGLDIWPYLAFVNRTVTIRSLEDNSELFTINPGSAICVGEMDALGRYPLPYHRTTGYVTADDIEYLLPVEDYETAQSGDLISVMTTYFAVGKSTLMYQGRNWNIRLASTLISGTVLEPGETYDQYEVIGPYRKSTGYHLAPIMSQTALSGYGGGTCQVNTTFYIANIQLPILITHRKVHAEVGIYYCKQGFDAAVGGGDINLTLVNTLPYAIRYQYFISDGVLTCAIFRE